MTLILSGTDGLSDVDGSAATPAIRGTDANTGIFFPAADTIAFAEGGTEVARMNSLANVLIGATSGFVGDTRLHVQSASGQRSADFFRDNSIVSDVDVFRVIANDGGGTVVASARTSGVIAARGIQFPVTQSPSGDANTLDDYEEGTWTPGVAYGGGSAGQVYDSQAGIYVKVGRIVMVNGIFSITNNGSSTGIATISGLPFPIASSGTGTFMGDGFTGTFAQLGLLFSPGICNIAVQNGGTGSLGGWGNTNQTNMSGGGKYISMTYLTNN
jgi:hypothetical protein